ncbi:MAG: SDR family NAD(P)-dependent oxidoreductase [Pyrinomonadaceae bacterium]
MASYSQHAFSEKVALVTDGSNPVGRAVAMQLALYGAYVIAGFPPSSGERSDALEELRSLGTLANAFEADVSNAEGAENLIAEVGKQYGRLDLLVNCQDFRSGSSFIDTDPALFDKTVDRNFRSLFFVTKYALSLMESRPRPKIVNVISNCDSEESSKDPAYVAVNSAAVGFMTALRDLLSNNFRINTVRVSEKEKDPGKFDVPDDELFRRRKKAEPDDAARTVLYLLSSEAIGINGQVFVVE